MKIKTHPSTASELRSLALAYKDLARLDQARARKSPQNKTSL